MPNWNPYDNVRIKGPRPWVDVTHPDYGTPANGSAALQAAHDALPSAGGIIKLHAEEYTWLSSVTISKANVILLGSGRQGTVLKAGANIATGAIIVTGGNFTAYDIEYHGNKSVYGSGSHGWDLTNASNATLFDCIAESCVGSGFRKGTGVSGLVFIRCTATANDIGFDIQGQAAHRLWGCTALANVSHGYNLQSIAETFVDMCDADQNGGVGILLQGCDYSSVLGCYATANKLHGFQLSGGAENNKLIGCQATANSTDPVNTSFGFRLTDAGTKENIILGCVALDNTVPPTQAWGIVEQGGADFNTIAFNRVKDGIQGQISMSGASSVFFKNMGFVTENNVLSSTFAIDSTGIKTVTIAHGLSYTPSAEHCQLTPVEVTNVDDWAYNLLKIESVDATNVVAKINVSTASATGAATAKLALRAQRH